MDNKDNLKYAGRTQTIAANSDSISDIVSRAALDMARAQSVEKVSLQDVDRIRKVGLEYLNQCAELGCLPSVRGVASRIGTTRQAIYDYASNHVGGALDLWLRDFSDICAELTMEAAMAGSIKEVSAIFTTKSRFGWRDTDRIEIGQIPTLIDRDNAEETAKLIAAKYVELPDE